MSTADPVAVAAARLRLTGHLPAADINGALIEPLRRRLDAAGMRLVTNGIVVTGPTEGTGPIEQFPDLDVYTWSTLPHQVFAAALSLCWPDPTTNPYPGQATTTDALLELIGADPTKPGGRTAHATGFIRDLHDAGLINHDGATVRLGPAVAAWNTDIVDSYRRIHARLPQPKGTSR